MIRWPRRFHLFAVIALASCPALAHAQAAAPNAFRPGQSIEVEYTPDSGKWLPAVVVEAVNDGYAYKVRLRTPGDAAESQFNIHFKRVRAAIAVAPTLAPMVPARAAGARLTAGNYGCTSAEYNSATGFHEFKPMGSVTLAGDGGYSYRGFRKPSTGSYASDDGRLSFRGGHLDGGQATPIADRPGQFTLTAPGNAARWSCKKVD